MLKYIIAIKKKKYKFEISKFTKLYICLET